MESLTNDAPNDVKQSSYQTKITYVMKEVLGGLVKGAINFTIVPR